MRDTFYFFLMHQLGNFFLQRLFVNLVRQLINNNGLPTITLNVFNVGARTHDHPATPCHVAIAHARDAINQSGRGKIRRWYDGNKVFNRHCGVCQQSQTSFNHFVQIVRWNIGRHANGNA